MLKAIFLIIVSSMLISLSANAQQLSVRSMEEMMEATASIANVKDLAGNPCAEVRVSAPGLDGCTFRGTQYIGEIQRNGAEYILYMPAGEKYLYMQHKDFEELKITFGDYGIKKLTGKHSYKISMSSTKGQSSLPVRIETDSKSKNIKFNISGVPFTMVYVEGGSFIMGDNNGYKTPEHEVILDNYYIGETVVTQALWEVIMGTTVEQQRKKEMEETLEKNLLEFPTGEKYPMSYVNYEESKEFAEKLSLITGSKFRLPTEAEWEYAAKGGKYKNKYEYSGSNNYSDVMDDYYFHPFHRMVKEQKANKLGLYDMSGYMQEWCQDWLDDYSKHSQRNPIINSRSETSHYLKKRIARGGFMLGGPACSVYCRHSEYPENRTYTTGIRLVLIDTPK